MNRAQVKVAGIVLAAGASSRMGTTKQLLTVGGETLIERIVRRALGSELDRVIVVLGHEAQRIEKNIAPLLIHPGVSVVENRDHRQGISSSIVAGIQAVEVTHDYAMIFLADMPGISSGMINLLCDRCLNSGLPIGAIREKDRPAHPVIFGRVLFSELKRLKGDVGARSLLKKYSHRVCLVEPLGDYNSLDIDTPEDYAGFEGMNVEH